MSDHAPEAPQADADSDGQESPAPRPAQQEIISSDDYPMRVLAGAGTGKTFTMVRKIERLIESGTPPNRILALTFTNKAADSMREKLTEKVGPQGYDIEAYTYHAVCHELLQDFAYHADLDPRYDIATDADRLAVVYEVLDEVPYRFTNPDVYENVDFASGADDRLLDFIQVMKRSGISLDEINAYLAPPARLIELEGVVERVREHVEIHLRVGWQSMTADRVTELCAKLDAFIRALETEAEALEDTGVEGHVQAYLEAMMDVAHQLSDFLEANLDAIAEGEDGLGYVCKLPAHLFGSYSGAPKGMPSISYTLPGTLATFIEEVQTVSDLVHGYEAYQDRLRTEGLVDFNDLVVETVELLNRDDISHWITEQFDYVFCDEYQDTDNVQFELVERLVTDDQLFVVGDDDQAIYEWRGANIANIGARLDETFPELVNYTLEENFRSRQPILDLANNAIEELDGRRSAKTLTAMGEKADASTGVVTITEAEEEAESAQQIRNAITRLLSGQTSLVDEPYDPGDVAILVRKKRHATPIIQALRRAGIPYELAGDLAPDSPGVKTVVAALKAIANPGDEVSLNRVLRWRYRLSEADLQTLNQISNDDRGLQTTLLTAPLAQFTEPARIESARTQLGPLWESRNAYSITGLYRDLVDRLDLEWFLSEQERRDLRQLEELIYSFEDGTIEPDLTADFIDYLTRHGAISEGSSREMEDQPDQAASAVSVMTVHKSKGLEFPVVITPQLTADEWSPSARTFDRMEHAIGGGDPTAVDFVQRDAREARRLFHVAVTRAEEYSILLGRGDEDGGSAEDGEAMSANTVDVAVGDAVPWSAAGVDFPIWQTVQDNLPPTAIDGTDSLATPISSWDRVAAIDAGEKLTREKGIAEVIQLARAMLAGKLPKSAAQPLDSAVIETPQPPSLLRKHSYTSLSALEACSRQHYLDYVVRAFDIQSAIGLESSVHSGEPDARSIGVLFHDTAEQAANGGCQTPQEWKQVADRMATARGGRDGLPAVNAAIDAYFSTEACAWSIESAERAFDLELADSTIIGKIDAVCRTPEDDIALLDYKVTKHRRDLDSDLQLPIYLLAAQELFDESVTTAGFVYVGDAGPALETRSFTEAELVQARDRVIDRLGIAESTEFETYTAGAYCEWCTHRELGCSDH